MKKYREEINPCYGCGCWDPDAGCMMPSIDKVFACPLNQEEKKMEFFMAMVPPTVTYQEHKVTMRNGRPVFYEPQEVKAARAKMRAYLSKYRPVTPYSGAVRLTTRWCFPCGNHSDGTYRTSKPDTDNLQKMIKDVMTDLGYWKDDAQVASELIEKFWAEIPGIYIRVEEI